MNRILYSTIALSLLLSACTSPLENDAPGVNINSEQTEHRATASLMAKVDVQEKQGHWERAAALLERALRIEPRNAWLWHRLAQLRLQQGQYQLAESLAQKSSVLARDDAQLRKKNTRLLIQARALANESVSY